MKKRLFVLLLTAFTLLFLSIGCFADWVASGDTITCNSGDTLEGGKMYNISSEYSFDTIKFFSTSEYGISVTLQINSGDNWYSGRVYLPYSDTVYTITCNNSITVQELVYNTPVIDDRYEEGKVAGYIEGFQQGLNDGRIQGQDDSNLVGSVISGFFSGLTSFINPILDIGIGVLTLRNLFYVLVYGFFIMLIVKIVRG